MRTVYEKSRLTKGRQACRAFERRARGPVDRALRMGLPIGVAAALTCLVGCHYSSPSPRVTVANEGWTAEGFHYEQRGEGETVIFLHGSGLDLRIWDEQADAAASRFHVIRYDLRGHGRTFTVGPANRGYVDLRDLMDDLGVQRASLVGLSAGAQVAVDFALAYPERVSRLVLASPSVTGYVPRGSFEWFAPIATAIKEQRYGDAASLYANSSFLRIDQDSRQQARLMRIALANARVWAATALQPDFQAPSVVERLNGIQAPSLVIVGGRDIDDVKRVATLLTSAVPCVRRVEILGSGHMVNMANSDGFNRAFLTFLSSPVGACSMPRSR
jgi:pimeloyl-ACP methyl ester carboxylesterase